MPEANDMELLREYAQSGSESAFAELVQRHINLVYSVAQRHVGITAHAEEITQAVFIILARKASSLRPNTVLEGWLHTTTRLTALSFLRGERRRQFREQEAYMQSTPYEADDTSHDATWERLAPLLDDAISRLGQKDRDALVLRFFKDKSIREVASALAMNEAAAQRRVLRALEKLRKIFVKRGVSLTSAIIVGAISTNSVQAAPVALAQAVTTAAVVKGAAVSASTLTLIKGALKIMAWTKMKIAVSAAVIIVCAIGSGAGFYAYHSTHRDAASELWVALHMQRPTKGIWSYPSEKVARAILDFGSKRADAFPILEKAAKGSDSEARMQAIAAIGMIVRTAPPKFYEQMGEPATNAIPFLRELLFANGDLSSFALLSLRGLFEAKDIPDLADLLVRSHDEEPLKKSTADVHNSQTAQIVFAKANNNQQLQRYIPEAIAEIIRQKPEAAVPFISSVEDLLDDANPDVRFGAACALAKYKNVNDQKIFKELTDGLKINYDTLGPSRNPRLNSEDGLKQLMAVETLQHIGPDAKPLIPALLDFANSTRDKLMREHALAAIGYIDTNLQSTMPEVDQALKSDQTFKNVSPQ